MQLSLNTSVWYLEEHAKSVRQEMQRQSYKERLCRMAEKPHKRNWLRRVSLRMPVLSVTTQKK